MQESDACWLYIGREVMDTERLWWWWWEVRGDCGRAPLAATEATDLTPDWESEEALHWEGVSGEEPAVASQVEDEEGEVVVEEKEEEMEQVEEEMVLCRLQELWEDYREKDNNEIANICKASESFWENVPILLT